MNLSVSHPLPLWRRFLWLVPFLLFSFSAGAADDKNANELENLYKALNMLNQEQQAIYQQFQMVQELLRRNLQSPDSRLGYTVQGMGDFPNYADVVEARKGVYEREETLYKQAEQLMERYGEVEEQKKPLRERILSLTLSK